MNVDSNKPRGASVWRWIVTGIPAYSTWVLLNLLIVVILPVLFTVALLDKKKGYPVLNGFGSVFARLYFMRAMSLFNVHKFFEIPTSEEVARHQPCIFVSNHRSWLDALFALALFPGARIPVKEAYVNAPILGLIIRWIGCIPLDSTSRSSVKEALDTARDYLEKGVSLFVFPEGTRAKSTSMLPFSDVFFRLAIESNLPVVPVLMHSDRRCMGPGDGSGSMLTEKPANWRIRILEPITRDPRDRASDLSRMSRKLLSRHLGKLDVQSGGW